MFSYTSMNSASEATSKLAPDLVERADDGRRGVGLDGVVGLDPGQVLVEGLVVGANDVVIDHHHRRALLAGDLL